MLPPGQQSGASDSRGRDRVRRPDAATNLRHSRDETPSLQAHRAARTRDSVRAYEQLLMLARMPDAVNPVGARSASRKMQGGRIGPSDQFTRSTLAQHERQIGQAAQGHDTPARIDCIDPIDARQSRLIPHDQAASREAREIERLARIRSIVEVFFLFLVELVEILVVVEVVVLSSSMSMSSISSSSSSSSLRLPRLVESSSSKSSSSSSKSSFVEAFLVVEFFLFGFFLLVVGMASDEDGRGGPTSHPTDASAAVGSARVASDSRQSSIESVLRPREFIGEFPLTNALRMAGLAPW